MLKAAPIQVLFLEEETSLFLRASEGVFSRKSVSRMPGWRPGVPRRPQSFKSSLYIVAGPSQISSNRCSIIIRSTEYLKGTQNRRVMNLQQLKGSDWWANQERKRMGWKWLPSLINVYGNSPCSRSGLSQKWFFVQYFEHSPTSGGLSLLLWWHILHSYND